MSFLLYVKKERKTFARIIFNSLSGKNIIALEFTGNALPEVLFKIKDDFDKNGVKYSYFEQTPAIFEES